MGITSGVLPPLGAEGVLPPRAAEAAKIARAKPAQLVAGAPAKWKTPETPRPAAKA